MLFVKNHWKLFFQLEKSQFKNTMHKITFTPVQSFISLVFVQSLSHSWLFVVWIFSEVGRSVDIKVFQCADGFTTLAVCAVWSIHHPGMTHWPHKGGTKRSQSSCSDCIKLRTMKFLDIIHHPAVQQKGCLWNVNIREINRTSCFTDSVLLQLNTVFKCVISQHESLPYFLPFK